MKLYSLCVEYCLRRRLHLTDSPDILRWIEEDSVRLVFFGFLIITWMKMDSEEEYYGREGGEKIIRKSAIILIRECTTSSLKLEILGFRLDQCKVATVRSRIIME